MIHKMSAGFFYQDGDTVNTIQNNSWSLRRDMFIANAANRTYTKNGRNFVGKLFHDLKDLKTGIPPGGKTFLHF